MNSLLIPIIVALIVLLVVVLAGYLIYTVSVGNKKEVERKWTDPKFHD